MRRLLVGLFVFAACGMSSSYAHRLSARSGPPPDGVSIASLTHGQMAVISDHLPEIRALAKTRTGFDMTAWRLEDYLNLQSFVCFWGFVPRSIEDENSPFNECAHAYLAAGRALLLRLRTTPGVDRRGVEDLIGRIEREMLANGASLSLCRFSDEPFNTNEIIYPRWSGIPLHPPTAALAAALLAILGGAMWSALPKRQAA